MFGFRFVVAVVREEEDVVALDDIPSMRRIRWNFGISSYHWRTLAPTRLKIRSRGGMIFLVI